MFSAPPSATCTESTLPLMITERLLAEINSEQPPFSDQLQKLIQTALDSVSVTSKEFKIIKSQSVSIRPARVFDSRIYNWIRFEGPLGHPTGLTPGQ